MKRNCNSKVSFSLPLQKMYVKWLVYISYADIIATESSITFLARISENQTIYCPLLTSILVSVG